MVSFYLARLAAVASAFLVFARVNAAPTNATALEGLGQQARDILERATPAAPHWVAYGDKFVSGVTGPPPVSAVTVCLSSNLSLCLLIYVW
jgi:hypothetical protein